MSDPLEATIASRPLATLRRLVRQGGQPASVERCELCSAPLAVEHQHLIEPATRRLVCACDPCAVLFDQPAGERYRRIGRGGRMLADFVITTGSVGQPAGPDQHGLFLLQLGRRQDQCVLPESGRRHRIAVESRRLGRHRGRESGAELDAARRRGAACQPIGGHARLRRGRILSGADRRLLSARRPDPHPLARFVGRHGSLAATHAVFCRAPAALGGRRLRAADGAGSHG